ncbi:phosphate transporter [Dacryopinax primogenitus]|uniref:Phosphate transporter n=1 Tax=Dacryopinax primogenitus (strain DJM 731) TaxID=1858805 RepID=M5FSU9_DACPD|nr:phosphate transporter [Dacryopinax primogenitus]EJT98359.1 phosphate transporter [Dacryopinax primogenitus]
MAGAEYRSPSEKVVAEAVTLDARRRAALAEVDAAKFSWFHVKAVLVAGVGFFTDAYDIFAISIAATMLGLVYADATTLGTNADLGIKVATPVGTLVGQLLFGWLADLIGRKRMYGVELMIIIVATFGQALSAQGPNTAVTITGVIVVWRFIMGVGIGGDYPLSAVITSEFAATRIRGRMMCAVFAMQGFGNFTAAVVATVVVVAYKPYILSSGPQAVDYTWRLLIGLGCVPAVIALYFRLTIPETPRYTMDIERNVLQASVDVEQFLANQPYKHDPDAIVQRVQAPRASRRDFIAYFSQWKNGKVLLGTAYSWFALDIAFYGLGFNSSIVLTAIGFGTAATPTTNEGMYQTLYNVSTGNIILAVGGLIPGYWAAFLLVDSWGRKPLQMMGFAFLTAIFCAMGFGYWAMKTSQAAKSAFVWLYCMANFFENFGPNTTTFIIPGEAFPTRYRSTAHGISAASGKLGAILAQVGFSQLQKWDGQDWIGHILQIFAFFMLTGVFSTLLLPETKQQTLEELSNENQDGFITDVPPVRITDGGAIVTGAGGEMV